MRMDANAPDAIAHDVLVQLQKRNKLSSCFKGIVEDYQRVLRQCKEQEVRGPIRENSHSWHFWLGLGAARSVSNAEASSL